MIELRALSREEAAAYAELRLRGLREHPEAFVTVYEEERALPLARFEERLAGPPSDSVVHGAFIDGVLRGVIAVSRYAAPKLRHRANISGMYVAPEARGTGAARLLLQAAIATARSWEGVELVALSVSEASPVARALYVSAGFVPWGIAPDAVRVGGRSYGEEHLLLRLRANPA